MSEIFAGFRQQPGGTFAFTMVPNQFLDEIVPYEKPCVTKVVCLILRRTLGWIDEHGQRRTQDQVAYSEFAREMNMSIQAVADGLKVALEKGYIIRVKAGSLHNASGNPEGASYSLRWSVNVERANDSKIQIERGSENQSKPPANPALNFRDMKKKTESKKIEKVEINTSSTHANPKSYSSYIGNVITEIGRQFGDEDRLKLPNIKRALNLWQQIDLDEKTFVELIYQARDKTRARTSALSPANQTNPTQSRNRTPYFFKVLEDMLKVTLIEQKSTGFQASPTLTLSEPVCPVTPVLPSPVATLEPQKVEEAVAEIPMLAPAQSPTPPVSNQALLLQESWARQWSVTPEEVLKRWQAVIEHSGCPPVNLKTLGIEARLAGPQLRSALGLGENATLNGQQLDIILLFRNAFDARYTNRYIGVLEEAAQKVWGQPARMHTVILDAA